MQSGSQEPRAIEGQKAVPSPVALMTFNGLCPVQGTEGPWRIVQWHPLRCMGRRSICYWARPRLRRRWSC
eukprot:8252386-Pyramimonas_sp.AAC.1